MILCDICSKRIDSDSEGVPGIYYNNLGITGSDLNTQLGFKFDFEQVCTECWEKIDAVLGKIRTRQAVERETEVKTFISGLLAC